MARRFNPSTFFARGLLGLGVTGGLFGLGFAVYSVATTASVHRDMDVGRKERYGDSVTAADGASVQWRYDGFVVIDDPGFGVAVVSALPGILLAAAILVAAWLVFLVVVDVELGRPFSPTSGRRLRGAAGVVAIAVVAYPFLSAWADVTAFHAATLGESGGPGLEIVRDLFHSIPWFLVAALLAAFGQAFGEGQRLADETEGLV